LALCWRVVPWLSSRARFGFFSKLLAGHVAHGPDERRPARWFAPTIAFLRELARRLAM